MQVLWRAAKSVVESMERRAGLPFTSRARRSLHLAWEEGANKQHAYIGQEHFLLAFARDPECTAAQVLTSFKFDARGAVEAVIGKGDAVVPSETQLTERAQKALDLALQECAARGDSNVGTEHILLGICREGEGLGWGLLGEHGIGVEEVEAALAGLKHGPEVGETDE